MLQKVTRWILVLPGSILGGIAATFILHFLLYLLLTRFFSTYPEFPERALTPFAFAINFIMVGAAIAPYYKIEAALALLFIWVTFALILAIIHITGMDWFGKEISFEADGLAMASGIIGSFLGLFFVKNGLRYIALSITNNEVHESRSKQLKDQKTHDISDIVFLSLFILSAFNHTIRNIFFGFYLALILGMCWWSIKEKLYKTKTEKFNFVRDFFLAVCLVVGFFYSTAGVYVTIVCSLLTGGPFIFRTIQEVRHSNMVGSG